MNCDPYALEQAAKCFNCLPPEFLLNIETYLECQWYNALTPATPNIRIDQLGNFRITDTGDFIGV